MTKNNSASSSGFWKFFWVGGSIAWTSGVLILALMNMNSTKPIYDKFGDKILHAFAFAVGTVFWAKALDFVKRLSFREASLLGAAFCLSLGAAIEIIQKLTPWRSSDIRDFIADTLGVLFALILLTLAAKYNRPSKSS